MKILGAAAATNLYCFEDCVELFHAVNSQMASIASILEHCHVPGRRNHDEIGDDICVVGAGIHNEPVRLSPTLGARYSSDCLRERKKCHHFHLLRT